ncbi:hypothetical protein [Pseudonocardia xinjiangensis]|uniref:Uncharacterized protein n=1 Tax=Pseudonocardia xinjiangensis TaxID=75289 RepID=A0ABX1RPP9_9PSEU|nr:hypothetical protein [Pseudonocardia xinjiangensis]NMH81080.1 hypothetical protein [Pseudonocardia xinjiangensis]
MAKAAGNSSTNCRASPTRHAVPPGDSRSIIPTSACTDSTACTAVRPAAGLVSAAATNCVISAYWRACAQAMTFSHAPIRSSASNPSTGGPA